MVLKHSHRLVDGSTMGVCWGRGRGDASLMQCCWSCSVAVVVAFFICWAPFHTQRLVSTYANSAAAADAAADNDASNSTSATEPATEQAVQSVGDLIFFFVTGVLYYVSSVINPILYNIMSVKFRQAFAATILRCGCGRVRRGNLTCSRLTLAGDRSPATAVRHYRFASSGGAGRQSLELGDAGSQQRRVGDEVLQPLTSDNGRQVRQVQAADNIVLVDLHYAASSTTASNRQSAS